MALQRVLFDGSERHSLLPLTYLRPVCDCRVGLLTIREKWEALWPGEYHISTAKYLQPLFPTLNPEQSALYINGAVPPNEKLLHRLQQLQLGESLFYGDTLIASFQNKSGLNFQELSETTLNKNKCLSIDFEIEKIQYPEDILKYSPSEFLKDYKLLTQGKESSKLPSYVKTRGEEIFVASSAKLYDCILNAENGPIYIGPRSEVMENVVIRGPVGIGPDCGLHVGAKVYANTFLGPYCKIGGEIKRTTIFGYSNKGHEGYLGDSVLAEWCNLGANTNNSNLKNTYGEVSIWDISQNSFRNTARQFLGVILGDHTKSAINTAFMTGTVSGIFTNVFGQLNPPKFIPHFSWGSGEKYNIEKVIEVAQRTMSRCGLPPSASYINALRHIASQS